MKFQIILRFLLCGSLVLVTEIGAVAVVHEMVCAWYLHEHPTSHSTVLSDALADDMRFALTGVFWAGVTIAAALPIAIAGSRRIVRKLLPTKRPI
jgi:hypothetical protein